METALKGVGFEPVLTLQSTVTAHSSQRKLLAHLGPRTHRSGQEAVLRVAFHPGNQENVHCLVTANCKADLGSSVTHFVNENGEGGVLTDCDSMLSLTNCVSFRTLLLLV